MMGSATWFIWAGLAWVAVMILAITAIISVARSTVLSPTAKAVWIALAVVAPFFGAIAWFIYRSTESGTRDPVTRS
ncbi:PLDc N-terminal domain-containing protein [Arthrobacter sp. H20]|uniref:PLDc N-terminal domain-containing protein n=1 Tax=Arthrobacter sp. H20 TaxID=1267981 RepID=UPI00047E7DD8|nr:PLDc N-terminal domain-containing protein [Arthrobacter sp. H20]